MATFNADNYIDVQERITRFWTEHPEGAIRTRLMSPPDDFSQCRYEAAVYKRAEQSAPDATGWAFELALPPGSKGPNATSHEENCETSAIGRALANMGYATTREDRPSRQEMQKVARGQAAASSTVRTVENPPAAVQNGNVQPRANPANAMSPAQMRFLIGLAKDLGMTVVGPDGSPHHNEMAMDAECQQRYAKLFQELNAAEASELVDAWQSMKKGGVTIKP